MYVHSYKLKARFCFKVQTEMNDHTCLGISNVIIHHDDRYCNTPYCSLLFNYFYFYKLTVEILLTKHHARATKIRRIGESSSENSNRLASRKELAHQQQGNLALLVFNDLEYKTQLKLRS